MNVNDGRLVVITITGRSFGIIIRDGVVADAAPVARWMVGKSEEEVARWCKRKGAKVWAEPR